ncbi:MAG: PrsW family intramembrane metalloprotease [Candidatus Micrarchaeota archaeon]
MLDANKEGVGGHCRLFSIFAFSVFLSAIIFSNLSYGADEDLADFAYGLPCEIKVGEKKLNASPSRIEVNIKIRNSDDENWIIYLLENTGGKWETERILGVVQKNSSGEFDIDFEARYRGETKEKTQYAIVAKGGAVLLGRYFTVEEDWSGYELGENKKILKTAQVVAPILAIVIISVLLVLAHWAYRSKSMQKFEKEYTMKTFFFPALKNRPLTEIIADILINPVFWVVEIILLLVIAATIWNTMVGEEKPTIIFLTLIGAFIMPLIYFALIWIYNNLVEKMPLRFLAGAFIWGITAAVISLVLNSTQARVLGSLLGVDNSIIILMTTAVVAPLIEEVAKGAGLLVLWGHHEFSDALHGLHLGLATGLGFSFVENWLYFASKTDPLQMGLASWAGLIIYRSFFNSIAHACFTGALGAALGWSKSHGWGKLALVSLIPGVMVATVLHSIFNITAIMDGFEALSSTFPVYKYNPTMIVTLLTIMMVLLVGATIERKRLRLRRAGRVRRKRRGR